MKSPATPGAEVTGEGEVEADEGAELGVYRKLTVKQFFLELNYLKTNRLTHTCVVSMREKKKKHQQNQHPKKKKPQQKKLIEKQQK